jgi:hypothetical protein
MIKKIVAVVGGRDFTDYNRLKKILDSVKGKILSLVSGGANGADKLVEKYAKDNKFKIKVFQADWDSLGKKAGPVRNKQIVDKSDVIIAFWNGISKGTESTIKIARKSEKILKIYNYGKKYIGLIKKK